MDIVNLEEQSSLINQFMYELRNVNIQTDRMRFRRNIERIGEIMAYEISKHLNYQKKNTQTPLGNKDIDVIRDQPVIGSIMRAGLPLHQGILNYFDQADNTFVSAFRKHTTEEEFDIQLDYVATPDLNDRVLILVDPMLATARSMVDVYEQLMKYGTPKFTHVVSVISAQQGVNYLEEKLGDKKIKLWTAAIDPNLNSMSYIVPGLGDAGDLAFGQKL